MSSNVSSPLSTSKFHLVKPFPVKLDQYIDHFLYQLNISQDILVYCYLLLEGFLNSGHVTQFTIHKLMFTALCLSYKFTITPWISIHMLERIGGLKKGELPGLELELLRLLNWKLKFKRHADAHEIIIKAAAEGTIQEICEEIEDDEAFLITEDPNLIFSELEAFFSFE